MADSAAPSEEIQINVKGPSELKLQITITTDKTVLDLKEAIAAKSDVTADRQRLIYSGRVLKDEDVLSVYKIQSSHTIHMVKGVSRSAAPSQSAPQPLPTMQTGQNPNDPLTQLNSSRGFGAMAGFNPFAQMGVNPNDPNMMQGMLNNPNFVDQMSSVMADPAIMEQIIASNPQLAAMGPQMRQIFQSEAFRNMLSNPETLRTMLQMSSMMRGGPGGDMTGFPAPGLPSSAQGAGSGTTTSAPPPIPPFFNPFFPPPAAGATGASGADANASSTAGTAGANPFPMFDPAAMQQMMSALGGGGGGFGAFGAPAAPADTRPPEERFQMQLEQLQGIGFTNASQNIRALQASGGNVQAAIEYILDGGGL